MKFMPRQPVTTTNTTQKLTYPILNGMDVCIFSNIYKLISIVFSFNIPDVSSAVSLLQSVLNHDTMHTSFCHSQLRKKKQPSAKWQVMSLLFCRLFCGFLLEWNVY